MPIVAAVLAIVSLFLAACSVEESPAVPAELAPWVRTVPVRSDGETAFALSGRVRARFETPVAFQVDGVISARRVDAGQAVTAGQVLFELDPKDLQESVRAAAAEREAAQAELQTVEDELARQRDLMDKGFVSETSYNRAVLAERAARARLRADEANLERARNALGYAVLHANRPGVLIEVLGEPGQVVVRGQKLAVLAVEGEREIEVALPDGMQPPQHGRALSPGGVAVNIELRETAGAADPASMTWRTRYRLADGSDFPLGSVVRVDFRKASADQVFEVPIGALDERAGGARVWRVVDGKAQPLPVEVLALAQETARISAELPGDARVVAFGTHLLTPGMAVREQQR